MKQEKITAVMVLLVLIALGCFLAIMTLELVDGMQSAARIDKVGLASSLKPLLKYNGLQQWFVMLFGTMLLFTAFAVFTYTYQKKL